MIATLTKPNIFKSTIKGHSRPDLFFPDVAHKLQKLNSRRLSEYLEIYFIDFNYRFRFEMISVDYITEIQKIELELKFDNNTLTANLVGNPDEKDVFYFQHFEIQEKEIDKTALSSFLISTLWSMFGLSDMRITVFDFQDVFFVNKVPLNEISENLKNREIEYRIMVIEKALNTIIRFPEVFDATLIDYFYRSIVERKFDWEVITDAEPGKSEIIDSKENIFDQVLHLGKQKLTVKDKNTIEVESLTVPRLQNNAFGKEIKQLINLEDKFHSIFFDKYLNSFSNAFEDLNDEQIKAVTEKPILEEEAFNF